MKTLNIDSQMLNSIQNCARKTQYSFVYNLQPLEKEEALEKGDLMHKMLEVYYSLKLDEGANMDSPLWLELMNNADIRPAKTNAVEIGVDAGIYFASQMAIPAEISEEVIEQFKAYCEFYRHDDWHPISVEEVGSKIMYESEDLRIVYSFKVDLIAEKGNIIAPFDHKTSKQRKEPSSLSNQFIGYCYALGTNTIIVNKIGFQKTLKPAERFQRYVLSIDNARIEEWAENSIFWIIQYARYMEKDIFPMNLTSCDKYNGCIFRRICETDRENRGWKLERDFKTVEQWDVAKALEG